MPFMNPGETVETKTSTVEVTSTVEKFLPVGTHTFQLIVVDEEGNESEAAQVKVVVRDSQKPTAVILGPEAVELGKSFVLDGGRSSDIPPGKISAYRWTLLGRV